MAWSPVLSGSRWQEAVVPVPWSGDKRLLSLSPGFVHEQNGLVGFQCQCLGVNTSTHSRQSCTGNVSVHSEIMLP